MERLKDITFKDEKYGKISLWILRIGRALARQDVGIAEYIVLQLCYVLPFLRLPNQLILDYILGYNTLGIKRR